MTVVQPSEQPHNLVVAGDLVASAASALANVAESSSTATVLLRRLFIEDLWRNFITPLGSSRRYGEHELLHFIAAQPLKGLGTTLSVVLQHSDQETKKELSRLLQGASDSPLSFEEDSIDEAGPGITDEGQHQLNNPPPAVNEGKEQALRRIRSVRPDLHERVTRSEISVHKAMIEAGLRKPKFSVAKDSAADIASALRKHLAPEVRAEVARLLLDD